MDNLKDKLKKIGLYLVLPLFIIFSLLKIVFKYYTDKKLKEDRNKTDSIAEEIVDKITSLDLDIAVSKNKIENLNEKKNEDIKKTDSEDPNSFHNNR